jgi:MarR family transcriptional regulator for hemolysin
MRFVGRLLKWTSKEMGEVIEARLHAAGGSLMTWMVLHSLEDHEGDFQRALAERLNIEGPTMTRHLDRLERDGSIERRPDPTDRRATRIYATDEGRERLKAMWDVMERGEADLLRGLSADDVDDLERLLMRVRENVHRAANEDAEAAGRPARRLRTMHDDDQERGRTAV